ncbi:MAG: hypothetical protein A2W66_03010 [Deltaproteobacteria bacterium RIFCSPLOWO2_02_56_12]|jgi:uncharacterized protein YdcH (DUF465 family)|nr:MAG: hypothetical protein A2X89_07025 [Deltaproteobacteria bacterium GWD2_55_8]OGQ56586.1 MAG: hypothetical protein A2W66_03010 [Deltaproteobacteria bacterium RIFCSPLOWO2_02_56_12]OGQ73108.1 MAG: hypothetical protein A2W73_10470 [Deltaproteobacteria bacterium RIFCSPLOWO2_12_55_13]OGQ92665.1 MAG: hypothetical protein A2253_12690 [Deltaproteobacteria bacterium RIFOXYA2_FULL_55_11]HBA38293.1 DUF465 domain-containing protein [Deltaproteobacteria bacterium]
MERREEEFIISLMGKDPELKKYYEEHQELEKKLSGYQNKSHLTPLEEVEKKRLQKLKLAGKDKIMELLGKYR